MSRPASLLPLLSLLSLFLAPMASSLALPALVVAASVSESTTSLPSLDFGPLGSVAVAGNFAGLQLWDQQYATSLATAGNGTAASLWQRNTNGTLNALAATNAGGIISALCSTNARVYVGGAFTSFGNVQSANIASFDPATGQVDAMAGGLDGAVQSLACDDDSSTLFVGGAFIRPTGAAGNAAYAGHVASWSWASSAWSPLPFGGLSGDVRAIEPVGSGSARSVLFGGNFGLSLANSSSVSSAANFTAVPSVGSALVPISLASADVWSGPNADRAGFNEADSIFCPPGEDGTAGSTWLARDGGPAIIVVRLYRPLQVGGLRLGNSFFEGRGVRQFKIISIPDSIVQTFTYASDPADPSSPLTTCDWECPLAQNASVPYQDFLFANGSTYTGFQITIDEFYGDSAGLHLIQLLSDGAYAFADDRLNNANGTCATGLGTVPGSSASTTLGRWRETSVGGGLPGTQATVLVADVPIGSSVASSPAVTFTPYIGWEGDYTARLLVPGCNGMGSCGARTSVDVTVTPGSGAAPETRTITQTNGDDAAPVIYEGRLTQGASFSLRLSASATGGGSGDNYQLVANKVQLTASSTNGTQVGARRAANGLYEFVLPGGPGAFGDGASSASTVNAATAAVQNATRFDSLALGLPSGSNVRSIASSSDGQAAFVGGTFTYAQNGTTLRSFLAYPPSSVVVPQGGLAGAVNAVLVQGEYVYAGGDFAATADGSTTGLGGVARWRFGTSAARWEALTGGPVPRFEGGVVALEVADNGHILAAGSTSALATYNPSESSWVTTDGGYFSGDIDAIGSTYVAGTVRSALRYSASSAATLESNDGQPTIVPLGYSFDAPSPPSASAPAPSSSASTPALVKRHDHAHRALLRARAPAPSATSLPSAFPATSTESEILAGAYWQNGSDTVNVLGGRFSAGSARNVAFVDDDSLQALAGLPTFDGVVRSLAVEGDLLYIGGSITTADSRQGLIIYDLARQTLAPNQPLLQAYDGTTVTVNVVAPRPNNASAIVAAGSFAAAGSLPCLSICQWNLDSNQWTALGSGLNGVVGSLDFAGDDAAVLIAAGDFQLNGVTTYVAQWDFAAQTWTPLAGGAAVPGPATAVSASGQNLQNVFLAGSAASTPYVVRWNGSEWSDVGSGALASGVVQQLSFVPLSEDHAENAVVEKDRVLMASGSFGLANGVGSVSSALFDGATWQPFLVTASQSGGPGAVAGMFFSSRTFRSAKRFLSVGIVVLIAIAIALGIVFLLVLLGLLIALRHRNNDKSEPSAYPVAPLADDASSSRATTPAKRRPTSLLATLNAATAMMAMEKDTKMRSRSVTPDDSASIRDGAGAAYDDSFDDADDSHVVEDGEIAAARYSFVGENAGELTVAKGQELTVLERDGEWVRVLDSVGNQGLVPSSYLL